MWSICSGKLITVKVLGIVLFKNLSEHNVQVKAMQAQYKPHLIGLERESKSGQVKAIIIVFLIESLTRLLKQGWIQVKG